MKAMRTRHAADLLYSLALFCVFAACALMVVLMGADVYKKTVSAAEADYNSRTCVSYIATKLRQGDTQGAIAVQQLGGRSALSLDQEVGGTRYRTWLYQDGGQLCEQFVPADLQPDPAQGQQIMPLQGLEFSLDPSGRLKVTATQTDGTTETLYYTLRSTAG